MIMDSDLSVLCVRETVFLHLQDGIAFSQIVLFCWNQPWSRSGCHLHKNGKCCTYKRFDLAMQKDWALSYLITPKILVENELTFLPELSQRSPFVLFCFIHPSWMFFSAVESTYGTELLSHVFRPPWAQRPAQASHVWAVASFVYEMACLEKPLMLHPAICMRVTSNQIKASKISLMFTGAKITFQPYLCYSLHLKT